MPSSPLSSKKTSAHEAHGVKVPSKARRKPTVAFFTLKAHSKMATYCPRYSLFTPRSGRRKFRSPVQIPSQVLLWTSRTPSPSSSRAHSRRPGLWQTAFLTRWCSGRWAYASHSSVLMTAPATVAAKTLGSNSCRVLCLTTSMRTWPVSRPTTPRTGGRSFSQVPWPRTLLARRRGGSAGLSCHFPFFPRVLIHLVAFNHSVRQSRFRTRLAGQGLHLMTPDQQPATVCFQLTCQLGRRRTQGNSSKQLDDLDHAELGPLPDRSPEGVEAASTGLTAVIQHRGLVALMDVSFRQRVPAWTAQAVRLKQRNQKVIATLGIQKIVEGEVHVWRALSRKELEHHARSFPVSAFPHPFFTPCAA